jgi:hypothetical protein
MILDFNFKNYKCRYFIGNQLFRGFCFSSGCGTGKYGTNKQRSHVTIIWSKDQEDLNYCFLDRKTMLNYFLDLQRELGFKLISFHENKYDYNLQISIVANKRWFVYVSTFIRYVYEFPFSLITYCALQNKDNFKGLQTSHIIQFYIALFYNGAQCHNHGGFKHAFSNMNCKQQFSMLKNNFNDSKYLVCLKDVGLFDIKYLSKINTKCLPQIVEKINNIANKTWISNEKNICRW